MSFIWPVADRRVWVAGHRGLVGGAVARRLGEAGADVLTVDRSALDLREQAAVERWTQQHRPDAIVLCAATVGGIQANRSRPVDFLEDNLLIATNVIRAAHRSDVDRLLNLGSSCIYPRVAPQPLQEATLLTGPLEPSNAWYSVAKIAAIKLCDAYRQQHGRHYISAMPTNLYGPGDTFDPEQSHVIPALILRFDAARRDGDEEVVVWGTGTPLREFLFVDDLAEALLCLLERFDDPGPINVGSGEELSIAQLAETIADAVGYRGRIVFDPARPDGTPRKVLDSGRIRSLGWRPTVPLRDGLERTVAWWRDQLRGAEHGPTSRESTDG